jgi:hypothetical protein
MKYTPYEVGEKFVDNRANWDLTQEEIENIYSQVKDKFPYTSSKDKKDFLDGVKNRILEIVKERFS